MPVQFNHTIVYARDRQATAAFLTDLLGLPAPYPHGPFLVVEVDNGVSLDVLAADGPIAPQHYAFTVTEPEFDQVLARVRDRGTPYWADPFHRQPGEINHWNGGRGLYVADPAGHSVEVLTRP